MVLVPPIPTAPLLNTGLPGWTQNLSLFGLTAIAWDRTPLDQRVNTLDDVIGFLKNEPERHAALILRTEQALVDLVTGQTESLERSHMAELLTSLRHLRESRADLLVRDPYLERYRVITRPLDDTASPLRMRAQSRFFEHSSAGLSVLESFGRTAVGAWGDDVLKARLAFRAVALPQSQSRISGLQSFAFSTADLRKKMNALIERGFDVRFAPVPGEFLFEDEKRFRERAAEMEIVGGRRAVYWIAAHKTTTPLSAWLRKFIDEADSVRGPFPIQTLTVANRNVATDSPQMGDILQSVFFGRPVDWDDFRKGFAIDVPRYVTQNVSLDHEKDGAIRIIATITTKAGEPAAKLSGRLAPPPSDGLWIAQGDDLNQDLLAGFDPERALRHLNQGIGRRSLTHILSFLHRLGVNALDMNARGQGLTFMPTIGFDFPDETTRRKILAEFREYVEEFDSSEKTNRALMDVRTSWDIVRFKNDRQEPVGREFMAHYAGSHRSGIPLRFWLSSDYAGWSLLLGPDLALHPNMGGEDRSAENARALANGVIEERIRRIRQSPPSIDLSLPLAVREELARLREIIVHQAEKLEITQTRADYDDLTQLLKREPFEAQNDELEQSLSANRKGDHPEGHWVMMVDIDHFKKINDTFGHSAGDDALRRVAMVLKNSVRTGDLVCRWGGEEFALVLRHSGKEGMERVADLILQRIRSIIFEPKKGLRHPLTATIGSAPFVIVPRRKKTSGEFNPWKTEEIIPDSLHAAIDAADDQLYEGKHAGRNQVAHGRELVAKALKAAKR